MSGLREQDENGCYARSTLPALRHFVANVRTFDLAIEFDRDLLDVRTEGTIGNTMRMADITHQRSVLYRRSHILWTFLINSIYRSMFTGMFMPYVSNKP